MLISATLLGSLLTPLSVWWVFSSTRYRLPEDDGELERYYNCWFVDGTSAARTFHERVNGCFHRAWQILGADHLSVTRLIFGGLRWFCRVTIILVPLGLKLAIGNQLPWWAVLISIAVLVICWGYTVAYGIVKDRVIFHEKVRRSEKRLATDLGRVMSDAHLKVGTTDPAKRKAAIREVLRCIKSRARIATADFEDSYLEVTLLTFANADCTKIAVTERASGQRSIGTVVDSWKTLAYYAAKRGKSRTINHLQRFSPFPNEGLSDRLERPPYRSILVLPVLKVEDSAKTCLGVVAIDSAKPFHFWLCHDELITRLAPYLSLLRLLLDGTDHQAIAVTQTS